MFFTFFSQTSFNGFFVVGINLEKTRFYFFNQNFFLHCFPVCFCYFFAAKPRFFPFVGALLWSAAQALLRYFVKRRLSTVLFFFCRRRLLSNSHYCCLFLTYKAYMAEFCFMFNWVNLFYFVFFLFRLVLFFSFL